MTSLIPFSSKRKENEIGNGNEAQEQFLKFFSSNLYPNNINTILKKRKENTSEALM